MVFKRSMVILLAAVALATPTVSFAQSERGSITGVVDDTTKAVVPGVSVKVINTATNATTNRRLLGFRHLQRRQPSAWNLSDRGLAPGLSVGHRRRHPAHRGRDRARST